MAAIAEIAEIEKQHTVSAALEWAHAKICRMCGAHFASKDKRKIFCTKKCASRHSDLTTRQQRNAEQKKRAGSKGRGKELSATGYKLESVVAINLVQRGYVLFKPEFDAMQGDFVAIKKKKRLLIEVKKGIERKDRTDIRIWGSGSKIRLALENGDYDHCALVTHDFKIKYMPPLEESDENSEIKNLPHYSPLGEFSALGAITTAPTPRCGLE